VIAIDTNVLLRYLLSDDAVQSSKAVRLITGNRRVLITDAVLVETIWTLRGNKYQLTKDQLVEVVRALFEEKNIRFEDGQVIWVALNDYRTTKPFKGREVDLADAIIVNKSKYIANLSDEAFEGLYTFDKAAQKIPGAKIP